MKIELFPGPNRLQEWLDKKISHVALSGYVGNKLKGIAIIHGTESGKLCISDSELEKYLFWVDIIICCYPKQVCQEYRKKYPGIVNKIAFGYYDKQLQLNVIGKNHKHQITKVSIQEYEKC